VNPRSEPLLWLQLIGLGALPLQTLLLLLLLAGSDPGRLPGLERLFTWAIGALLPGLLLLRRPADPFSLLLVSTPLRARRELQRRMATLQEALALKVGLVVGIAGALALLVWSDEHAAMAAALSPLSASPRLVGLLLAALLLAVMVWQWQQAIQALWLLSRPSAAVAAATAMPTADIGDHRLCIGLPLLLPDPLKLAEPPAVGPAPTPPSPPAPAAPIAPIANPSEVAAATEVPIEPPATVPPVEPAPQEEPTTDPATAVGTETEPLVEPEPEPEAAAEVEAAAEMQAERELVAEAAADDPSESLAAPEAEVVVESQEVAVAQVVESEAEPGEVSDVEVVAEAQPDPEPPA